MLALPFCHESSAGLLLLPWATPPMANTFFAQASARESWLPALDWLLVHTRSWSKQMSSASADTEV